MKEIFMLFSYLVAKVYPIDHKLYLFSSFRGKYSDSSKKISEYIHEYYPDISIAWLLSNTENTDIPDYIIKVPINSNRRAWFESVSGTIVDNAYLGKCFFSKSIFSATKSKLLIKIKSRKNQKHFSTWHGTPIKNIGIDADNSLKVFCAPDNFEFILGNRFLLDVLKKTCCHNAKYSLIGSPKNSGMFSQINTDSKFNLGLPINKRIILFAPTFRTDSNDITDTNIMRSGINQLNLIDFDILFDLLSAKFGGDWVFVARFHYFVEKEIDWDGLNKKYPGKIINGNLHDDIVDYLECTDVLVTDASSTMFDFVETGRPCFLLFPDFDHYKNVERGLYFDIEELPFPLSTTFDDFINTIKCFDEDKYKTNAKLLLEKIGCVDDADSTKNVADYIVLSS